MLDRERITSEIRVARNRGEIAFLAAENIKRIACDDAGTMHSAARDRRFLAPRFSDGAAISCSQTPVIGGGCVAVLPRAAEKMQAPIPELHRAGVARFGQGRQSTPAARVKIESPHISHTRRAVRPDLPARKIEKTFRFTSQSAMRLRDFGRQFNALDPAVFG